MPWIDHADTSSRRLWSNNSSFHRYRSEEHTSELQSRVDLVCRLLLEKKKKNSSRDRREISSTDSRSFASMSFPPQDARHRTTTRLKTTLSSCSTTTSRCASSCLAPWT